MPCAEAFAHAACDFQSRLSVWCQPRGYFNDSDKILDSKGSLTGGGSGGGQEWDEDLNRDGRSPPAIPIPLST